MGSGGYGEIRSRMGQDRKYFDEVPPTLHEVPSTLGEVVPTLRSSPSPWSSLWLMLCINSVTPPTLALGHERSDIIPFPFVKYARPCSSVFLGREHYSIPFPFVKYAYPFSSSLMVVDVIQL
jgi:hypothetical protein